MTLIDAVRNTIRQLHSSRWVEGAWTCRTRSCERCQARPRASPGSTCFRPRGHGSRSALGAGTPSRRLVLRPGPGGLQPKTSPSRRPLPTKPCADSPRWACEPPQVVAGHRASQPAQCRPRLQQRQARLSVQVPHHEPPRRQPLDHLVQFRGLRSVRASFAGHCFDDALSVRVRLEPPDPPGPRV